MRVTTVFKRLLRLDDVNVTDVVFGLNVIIVSVALVRRRLWCPYCGFKTSTRYDTRAFPSRWRHLDMGTWADRDPLLAATPVLPRAWCRC